MGIGMLQVVSVTCDSPDCDAEELFDPPHDEARRKVREMGWAVSPSKGDGVTAWCPDHRRYQRRTWTPGRDAAERIGEVLG